MLPTSTVPWNWISIRKMIVTPKFQSIIWCTDTWVEKMVKSSAHIAEGGSHSRFTVHNMWTLLSISALVNKTAMPLRLPATTPAWMYSITRSLNGSRWRLKAPVMTVDWGTIGRQFFSQPRQSKSQRAMSARSTSILLRKPRSTTMSCLQQISVVCKCHESDLPLLYFRPVIVTWNSFES